MPIWNLTCPSCGTENHIPPELVEVVCGEVSCSCTCINCGVKFTAEREYWRWLGLTDAPPAEAPAVS
jgi:hypothetical protein